MGDDNSALIAASIQAATQSAGIVAQGRTNKKTRDWNEFMYNKQRQDALTDRDFQIAYNAPEAQMARYKAAGLNPNLIYGSSQGSSAPAVRSSSPGDWHPQAAQIGQAGSLTLDAYFNAKMKDAQIDNLKQQQDLIRETTRLRIAESENVRGRTDINSTNLDYLQSTQNIRRESLENKGILTHNQAEYSTANMPVSLQTAQASLARIRAGVDFTLSENERQKAMNSANLQIAAQRILMMRAQTANTEADRGRIFQAIENLRNNSQLQQMEIELRRGGVNSHDPAYMRMLGTLLNNVLNN